METPPTRINRTRNLIPARAVFAALMVTIIGLTVLNLVSFALQQWTTDNYWLSEVVQSLVRLFDTNGEANIPSWYSSSALLAASALLFVIATLKAQTADDYVLHWKCMGLIFLYLSLDETAVIHEMLSKPLQALLQTSGWLYYPWVLVAGFGIILLSILYAKFLLHLPAKIRRGCLLAGITFVCGAIVVECFQAKQHSIGQNSAVDVLVTTTIEEFLEMTGIALFIHTLLQYLNEQLPGQTSAAAADRHSAQQLAASSLQSTGKLKEAAVSGRFE